MPAVRVPDSPFVAIPVALPSPMPPAMHAPPLHLQGCPPHRCATNSLLSYRLISHLIALHPNHLLLPHQPVRHAAKEMLTFSKLVPVVVTCKSSLFLVSPDDDGSLDNLLRALRMLDRYCVGHCLWLHGWLDFLHHGLGLCLHICSTVVLGSE